MSSSDHAQYHAPEQDQEGTTQTGDELPTYDDLAAASGPNSRFGRWKGWVEKRAAERYADVTPEMREQRRARGWDLEPHRASITLPDPHKPLPPLIVNQPPTPAPLQVQTTNMTLPPISPFFTPERTPPLIPQTITPSHLRLSNFGSRFLPHTTSPIHSLLPLPGDRMLLIGHDDGLSVLDMFPQEWAEGGLLSKGPSEAQAKLIWQGEGVYQMSYLEVESNGSSTPQGVVLALVGRPEDDTAKDQEPSRTLRLYSLSSLVSLARWITTQKNARPLDLRRGFTVQAQQTPIKKKQHTSTHSLTKGLRSLILDSPSNSHSQDRMDQRVSFSPSSSTLSPTSSLTRLDLPYNRSNESLRERSAPARDNSGSSTDSGWELIDELPLKWAQDYVSLAGTRLGHTSVLCYDLYNDQNKRRAGTLLAIATKNTILLYETPKGERAFSFVKWPSLCGLQFLQEFYTPFHARSVTFVHQAYSDTIARSTSDAAHVRESSGGRGHHQRHSSMIGRFLNYGNQLCLFVIFEKKAGIIRIADAAVGEVEMYEGMNGRDSMAQPSSNARRSRMSYDGGGHFGFTKEIKGAWLPPESIEVPLTMTPSGRHHGLTQGMYCLSRGKQTHLFSSPLPANIPSTPPVQILQWNYQPKHVIPRVCLPDDEDDVTQPFLQLVAVGDDGVEVQEIPLSSLTSSKGKGRAIEPVRAYTDLGGDIDFLCLGGQWHRPAFANLSRNYSTTSTLSSSSFDSLSTDEIRAKLAREEGIYCQIRKGFEDWRVFWVGGTGGEIEDDSMAEY
ncbi:hypothetical protein NEOLEDRAFT_1166915 [Neolentinus lepideus HHB14362 ss-1]|uniref:Uncharacterized protein n=1 Tax=Neolentinus lepideus HHB14362 ss-1 TaxID=1314782 RepID=A0A165VB13_9AGAM|nr:hypothetical protein NEOLEDRAFT_1166915 [Neolentinus lepideus HHB14362 ss-1]